MRVLYLLSLLLAGQSAACQAALQAFLDSVYDVTIESDGTMNKLWFNTAGKLCGKPPEKDFASEHFCDRAIIGNAEKNAFEYAPLSTVRMIE